MEEIFEWKIDSFKDWKNKNKTDYINWCCEFGDTILYKIKDNLIEELKIEKDDILIDQEDWGWFLECKKGKTLYIINISYQGNENSTHLFTVFYEAKQINSFLFFKTTVDANVDQLNKFSKTINKIAAKNNIKVNPA